MINVSKPFLPPKEEFYALLDGVWQRNWWTNNGPLVNELELKLKEYLEIPHLLFLSNGTIALQIAIKALELTGEIITTPFSYVATCSSIIWEGCIPVFVDIDPYSLNIDPNSIEKAITKNTTAILATHVYGNPCDIDAIQGIAYKYKLKVIYDAAHCFGTKYKGKSVFSYGDISTTSFHATKLFHSIEGGAVFTQSPDLLRKMALLRNFGHEGPEDFAEVGINGKNSEVHAAMGLANFKYLDAILKSRKEQTAQYNKWFDRPDFQKVRLNSNAEVNYAYYPILFQNETQLLKVKKELEGNLIFPRRYFYPSLSRVPIFNPGVTPICEDAAKRVLCLPLYFQLSKEEIDFICRIIMRALNY